MANKNTTDAESVDLGFAEECEPWMITNRYFPSKIGGRPAWLELKNLPKINEITCTKCNKPAVFLCQVYAPIESKDDCFHRTIFLFVCKNESCYESNSTDNIFVLRSQLPRINKFYSPEPPNEGEQLPEVVGPSKLCCVCGCYARFACANCKNVNYCGQIHQKLDWKYHKPHCSKETITPTTTTTENQVASSLKLLFPEYEIVIEPEGENTDSSATNTTAVAESIENEEITEEKRRLQEYEELVKSGKIIGDLNYVPESELSQFIPENIEDKQFMKFKKRIKSNPEQVLRYHKNGQPLWISSSSSSIDDNNKCENNHVSIPNCENCGSKRVFEFQIMPQILNYLKDDHIDWGILAVYTCSESCDTKSNYLKEFVIKQDVTK